jgi:hypothetical protein
VNEIRKEVEGLMSRLRVLQRRENPSPELVDLIEHCNAKLYELAKLLPENNNFDPYMYGTADNGDTDDDI